MPSVYPWSVEANVLQQTEKHMMYVTRLFKGEAVLFVARDQCVCP